MTQPSNGFEIHTPKDAPEDSRETLETISQAYGFVPNILGIAAESPAALKAYATLNSLFKEQGSFSKTESEIVLLIISAYHGCGYCVAVHSTGAERTGVDEDTVEALRQGKELPDPKLQALAVFTRRMIDSRGWLDESDIQAFLDAGYTRRHILDLITALAMKTISNYTNHIADTPLDDAFSKKAWKKAS